mgnify:CR=1 FL=1
MKTITKLGMAAFFMLAMVFTSNAQIRLGLGINTGVALGEELSEWSSFGIGGGVSGEYMLTDNISAGLSIGLLSFSGNTETITDTVFDPNNPFAPPTTQETEIEYPTTTIIPIQLQGNYHFMPDEEFNFYAGLGVGIALVSPDLEGVDAATGLAITPHVGANYMFSDEFGLDLNLGYSIVNATFEDADESSDWSNLPINLGVVYIID